MEFANLLEEYEWYIRHLDVPDDKLPKPDEHMELHHARLKFYRGKGNRDDLFKLYEKLRVSHHEKYHEGRAERVEELLDEPAIRIARDFLRNLPPDDTIPGFEGFGNKARQELLLDIAQVDQPKRGPKTPASKRGGKRQEPTTPPEEVVQE